MPAFTSFLNLYKPGGGSTGLIMPDEVADIDRLNANSDLIDAWAVKVGDESTRQVHYAGIAAAMGGALVPPPKDGDTYQETDGNKILWRRVGGAWVTNEGGMYLIRPSSVTGCVVEADGSVAATGSNSIWDIECFSARFRRYKIFYNCRLNGQQAIQVQMRVGGAPVTASNYGFQSTESVGSSVVGFSALTTAWPTGVGTAVNQWGELVINSPFQTGANEYTSYLGNCANEHAGTRGIVFRSGVLSGSDSVAYTGFRFFTSGTTFESGSRLKVYGLA